MSKLGLRVISGAVLLAIVLLAIWLRGLVLAGAVIIASGLAAHEFFSMSRRAGYRPFYPAGVALAIVLTLRGDLPARLLGDSASVGAPAELLPLVLVLLLLFARRPYPLGRPAAAGIQSGIVSTTGTAPHLHERSPYLVWADIGITLAGAIYTGGLLSYALLLAAVPEGGHGAGGVAWLLVVLLGTAACDTGAYFVGSAFGRRKLIPHISPGKTWEGLAGGTLGSVIAAVALSGLLGVGVAAAVVLGLIVCAAAVSGDLCESLVKRAAGAKDSGTLIPGHGGVLDRLDSILFVLPAVYLFSQVAA